MSRSFRIPKSPDRLHPRVKDREQLPPSLDWLSVGWDVGINVRQGGVVRCHLRIGLASVFPVPNILGHPQPGTAELSPSTAQPWLLLSHLISKVCCHFTAAPLSTLVQFLVLDLPGRCSLYSWISWGRIGGLWGWEMPWRCSHPWGKAPAPPFCVSLSFFQSWTPASCWGKFFCHLQSMIQSIYIDDFPREHATCCIPVFMEWLWKFPYT